jgi:hypothetical protein
MGGDPLPLTGSKILWYARFTQTGTCDDMWTSPLAGSVLDDLIDMKGTDTLLPLRHAL